MRDDHPEAALFRSPPENRQVRSDQRGAVLTWILLAVLAGIIIIIILILIVSSQPPTLPEL